jgi:hypothetical protein
MKVCLSFLLIMLTLTVFSQQDDSVGIVSGTFEMGYKKSNPTLRYRYDSVSQTHDYSDNWDFDKDGINDELYFIGTGGAHLYYYLKVVLSTDHKPRQFDFIQTDFPLLVATDTLDFKKRSSGFLVAESGESFIPTINVCLDEQTVLNNKELKKRRLKSKHIMLRFENGKTKFGSL